MREFFDLLKKKTSYVGVLKSLLKDRITQVLGVGGVMLMVSSTAVQGQDEYTQMIQDAFDGEVVLPENFPEISENYIKPLHQVLIDVGMGDIFTGDDAANITALVMMRGNDGFLEQLTYLENSFPDPIINEEWKQAIIKIFPQDEVIEDAI